MDILKTSQKPLVSIGLVAINREQFIEKVIKSLLGQTYKNIELIISDSSKDGTGAICRKYAKLDRRIKYFKRRVDTGIPDNHNIVLKKAKGEYFIWAADDDYLDKRFISFHLSKMIKNKNIVLSLGAYYLFNEKKKIKYYLPYPPLLSGVPGVITFLQNPGPFIFGLFRRKILLEEGGFFTDNKTPKLKWWGNDYLTVFSVLMRGDIAYTNKFLYLKYDRMSSSIGDHLQNLGFSTNVSRLIKENLVARTLYFIDFYHMLRIVSRSRFSLKEKIIIYFHCFLHVLTFYLNYVKAVLMAIRDILIGLFRTKLHLTS